MIRHEPQCYGETDREGCRQAERIGVDPSGRDELGFFGNGNECRLGNGSGKADGKGKDQKPDDRAFGRELMCQALTDRKDPELKTLDKYSQTDSNDKEAKKNGEEVFGNLLKNENLKKCNDKYDRQKIFKRFAKEPRNNL